MTIRFRIFLIACLASSSLICQVPTDQDCLGAIPICEDIYVQTDAYSGEGNYPSEMALGVGCNFAETNSVWYTFTIQEDGLFSFILTPVAAADDYDWALYDLTDATCAEIATNPALEVSCNSYGEFGTNGPTGISTAEGGTGNSNGPGNAFGPPFNADLPVTSGEVYALLVMDWSGTPTGYTLDLSNTTATIYDNVGPQIASAELHCDNTIDVFFSENVVCGSLADVSWELEGDDGTIVTASSFSSDCLGDEGLTLGITLVFDEDIVPESGSETFSLNIINDLGNVYDLCGNEVAFDDLEFDFSTVPIEALPQVIDTDCDVSNGQVDASSILNALAPVTYDLSGVSQATPIFNGLSAGDYVLTVTDADGCVDIEAVTIGQPDHPVISSIESTPVTCGQGCTGTLTIQAGEVLSYSIDGGVNISPGNMFSGLCEGEYDIVVNSGNNCEASSIATIGSTSPVEAEMSVSPYSASIYNPSFTLINTSVGEVTTEWFIGSPSNYELVIGDSIQYVFPEPLPGLYDIILQVTDIEGCMSEVMAQVELLAEFSAFIPNSFTPNGDGINDTFLPILDGYVSDRYRLQIFDRWGTVIFETSNPAEAWIGQIDDGTHYPHSEIFHYKVSVEPISASGKEVMVGTVTMIR